MPPSKKPISRKPKRITPPMPPMYVRRYSSPRPLTPYRYYTPQRPPLPKKTLLNRSQNSLKTIAPYVALVTSLLTLYYTGKKVYGVGKNIERGWKRFSPTDVSTAKKILNGDASRYQVVEAIKEIQEIEKIKGKSSLTSNVANKLYNKLNKIDLMKKITEPNRVLAMKKKIQNEKNEKERRNKNPWEYFNGNNLT